MSYPPPPGSLPPSFSTHVQPPDAKGSIPPRSFSSFSTEQALSESRLPFGPPFQPRAVGAHSFSRNSVSAVVPSQLAGSTTSSPSSNTVQTLTNSGSSILRSEVYGSSGTPIIQNPFPLPGNSSNDRNYGYGPISTDPELETQIAQWQSAYTGKDHQGTSGMRNYNGGKWLDNPLVLPNQNGAFPASRQESHGTGAGLLNPDSGVAEVVTAADGKQKTVIRQGGGQSWQDPSLLEWDPAHFRLFVGNLAGEVTDDSLLKAFTKYTSVQKARVIRDKRTTKSKGYGFVSFSDGDEYFRAARDMQGKYIGSHPVLLRKSTTEIRPTVSRPHVKFNKRSKGSTGSGSKGAGAPQGIQKKQIKDRNGLKILG